MWRLPKTFTFWLALLSVFVCAHNLLGYDDKNLLLGYTNPLLLWFSSQFTRLHYSLESEQLFYLIWYVTHLVTWLLIGLVIDWGVSRIKRNKS